MEKKIRSSLGSLLLPWKIWKSIALIRFRLHAAANNVYKPIKSRNFWCLNISCGIIKNTQPQTISQNFSLSNWEIYNRGNSWHISSIASDFRRRFVDDRPLSKILLCFIFSVFFLLQENVLNRREVFRWEHFFSAFSNAVASKRSFSICLHVGVIWRLRSIDRAISYRREGIKKKN